MVLLAQNYSLQCTIFMKNASMNSYFIALIALKIQNIRDCSKQIRVSINKIRKLYWIKNVSKKTPTQYFLPS